MLSHTFSRSEESPCGLSEEGRVCPHGEKLALRASGEGAKLTMVEQQLTESKKSIARGASTGFPCWPCEHSVTIFMVAKVASSPDAGYIHLCPAHEVELAAELVRQS